MLNKIKSQMLNLGLKFISVDEKIVRMILETSPSNINEIVILPAVKLVMKKIVKRLQNKTVYGRVYNGVLNGIKVSVIRSQVGCPNAALTIECLKRSKAKIVVRVDFCGGIYGEDTSIEIGDVVVPKLAYCDDGTAPQYIRANQTLLNQLESISNPLSTVQNVIAGNHTIFISKPNEILKDLLIKEARVFNPKKAKEVLLWTTDALFCETFEFIRALKAINIKAIDMESSILFLLGQLYNLKTASILSVSDLPGHPQYDLLNSNEIHLDMETGINNAIKILINALPKIQHTL
ncbi:MAG: phosphorylase family protein [Promethearchaeota archaeon]